MRLQWTLAIANPIQSSLNVNPMPTHTNIKPIIVQYIPFVYTYAWRLSLDFFGPNIGDLVSKEIKI